jgi:hypothetical protein
MRKLSLCLALVAVCVGLAAPALAQRIAGGIRGKVTAVDATTQVPGAKVTVRNTETGLTRSVVTNSEGVFTFGDLPVGTYEISVVAPDYRTSVVENIGLNVADVREVNVTLEPGEIADEITVTSPQIVIETIGGEVANVISGEQIRELPLNGRNFTQLTQLMPGVSTPDNINFTNKGLLSGVDTSISGSSATGNLWAVDGADNNDHGSNRTILVYPSIEAIEEFKIHRNSYGPEFGGAGGAQINLVTKSGTNQYHGSLFTFVRDDSFNEKNYFLEQSGGEKEGLERKDYGFSAGGPILRDRLHFFVSGEWNDETRGVVRTFTVPTDAERMGDFSQTGACGGAVPIDPLTGQPFPGNVIPPDRLSPAGVALLELHPHATGPCGDWVEAVPTDIDWAQNNARLDWSVTDNARVLLRYTHDDWDNPAPNAGAANGLWGDDPFPAVDSAWKQPGDSLVFQLNQVFGSSVVNTFTYSMSGNEIEIERGADGGLNAELNQLIPTYFPEEGKLHPGGDRAHPVYWGGATGADLWTIAPWKNSQDLMQFKDDYQQVFGDHWVKVGALYSQNEKAENCCGASAFEAPHFWGASGINGWGATSGNRISDILLEDMYHGYDESAFEPAPVVEWDDIEVYVGDSWKVAPRLTVDYGVRYSRLKEVVARDDNIVAFYPELFDPALGNAPCNGIAQPPGTNPCAAAGLEGGGRAVSRSLVAEDTDNFAPRLGAAWDVFGTGNSVLRAGFGQFYQRERVGIQLDMAAQPPFAQNTSGIRPLDSADPTFLSQGFGVPNRGIDPDNETPYNLQYNVTWEQRLGASSSLELSYVGNRGRHLVNKYDVNQVPRGDLNGNGVPDRLDYIRAGGDGDGSVRPFFSGGNNRILYWDYNGESEYDALQTQLQTRWGRASQAQVSYTWSRFKANTSLLSSSAGEENVQATDIADFGLDWADADLAREHVFSASAIWNLPTFEGQGGFMRYVLGDWTIAGVVGYSTGVPVTLYVTGIPELGGGGWVGTGYNGNNRPIRVPGVSCGGRGNQIVNSAAFTLDGARLGDVSQMARRGECEGPDYFQVDLSFYKHIPLGKRLDGQFRFEIFNLTDEVNFVSNSIALNASPFNVVFGNDAGEVVPLAEATQILSADFPENWGEATAVRNPRQVQLGFKLSF